MNFSNTITLISRTYENDAYGIQRAKTQENTVFCNVTSISGAEFFEAAQTGVKPELRFVIYSFEYNGETLVEYNGTEYTVYRTFARSKDLIELYVTKDGGT